MKIILGSIQHLNSFNIKTKEIKDYNSNEYLKSIKDLYIFEDSYLEDIKDFYNFYSNEKLTNYLKSINLSNDPRYVRDVEVMNLLNGKNLYIIDSIDFKEIINPSNTNILIDQSNLVFKDLTNQELNDYSTKVTYVQDNLGMPIDSFLVYEDYKTNKTYVKFITLDDNEEYLFSRERVDELYKEFLFKQVMSKNPNKKELEEIFKTKKEKLKERTISKTEETKIQDKILRILEKMNKEQSQGIALKIDGIESLLELGCEVMLTGGDPIKLTTLFASKTIECGINEVSKELLENVGISSDILEFCVNIKKDGLFETIIKEGKIVIKNGNIYENEKEEINDDNLEL